MLLLPGTGLAFPASVPRRQFFPSPVLLVTASSRSGVLNLTVTDSNVLVPVVGVLEAATGGVNKTKKDVDGVIP